MTRTFFHFTLLGLATMACAQAHVTLPPDSALVGTVYTAAFHVGHACKDATMTTGITVRLPAGFKLIDAQDRPGWKLTAQGQEVTWSANTDADALSGHEKTRFVLRGQLPGQPGVLWFKVLQRCDQGLSADWAEMPDSNQSTKPAYPAARLDVIVAPQMPTAVP
jgi:periplasmic copper chaperone A